MFDNEGRSGLEPARNITERAATVTAEGKRRRLHPHRMRGRLARIRMLVSVLLLQVYFFIPWLQLQGRPLLRFDILGGAIHCAGFVFPFSAVSMLIFFLLAFVFAVATLTSLKGRIWCGTACPQTVYLDFVIRPIEEFFEGPASRRVLRDKEPFKPGNVLRKLGKHVAFLIVAALVANNFLGYLFDPSEVIRWMTGDPGEHVWQFGLMSAVMLVFYGDFAWFREQFCSFVCPYARLQSALMDDVTPTVFYDSIRGEPRGKKSGACGDCIDCGLCVRVCPAGIDIRKGLQLECVQCLRCVDACELIMTNLKRPRGLIRFGQPVEGKADGAGRGWRIRPLIYALLLLAVLLAASFRVLNREKVELTLTRVPGPAYVAGADGVIANVFSMRLFNATAESLEFPVTSPDPGVDVDCGACGKPLQPFEERRGIIVVKYRNSGKSPGTARLLAGLPPRRIDVPLLGPDEGGR